MVLFFVLFFFFKQKTAYEIVSGDWSSDVCSSDLATRERARTAGLGTPELGCDPGGPGRSRTAPDGAWRAAHARAAAAISARHVRRPDPGRQRGHPLDPWRGPLRSALVGPVGRGRDRAGHDLVGWSRLLRPQGRAQPAPVRLV